MRNQLRALPVTVGLIAALVAIVTVGAGPQPSVSDTGVGEISGSAYSHPLPPSLSPSIHVQGASLVALVSVESASAPAFDSSLSDTAIADGLVPGGIYVLKTAKVVEYLKGEGPETITIRTWGGEIDGIRMVASDGVRLEVGDEAVVFLNSTETLPGWTLLNSYTIADGIAHSELDQRSLPADELLVMLRGAADDPAPAPLPYPDFLPPVTEVSKSAVIAQVAITSTEETGAGTLIRASVSEPIKGDPGKTVEFTMLRAYGGGDVPADARLGAGDEAVVFLRDDGTLFDWYLYWNDGVASSWVDEVSMPVERLLDVLRDKVALN